MKRINAVLVSAAALLLPIGGAAAGVTAAEASTSPVHAAVAPSSTPPLYQLVNYNSGKCAGLYGTSTADNTVFTQYSCTATGFNDVWNFIANFSGSGGTWYQIQNAYSGKCAQPVNLSKTVGADIVQVTCLPPASSSGSCSNSCSAQLWRIETTSPFSSYSYNYYYNRYSNQCMNAKEGSTADGTHIAQTNCGSSHLSDMWCINGALHCSPGVSRPFGS